MARRGEKTILVVERAGARAVAAQDGEVRISYGWADKGPKAKA